jgi:uncharacterized coiled-coil DUF342 family protein
MDSPAMLERIGVLNNIVDQQARDISALYQRIEELERRETTEVSGYSVEHLERRLDQLENFDLDDALKEATIPAEVIQGLDYAIVEAVSDMRVKLTLSVPEEEA